jgi:hypothetical protein
MLIRILTKISPSYFECKNTVDEMCMAEKRGLLSLPVKLRSRAGPVFMSSFCHRISSPSSWAILKHKITSRQNLCEAQNWLRYIARQSTDEVSSSFIASCFLSVPTRVAKYVKSGKA